MSNAYDTSSYSNERTNTVNGAITVNNGYLYMNGINNQKSSLTNTIKGNLNINNNGYVSMTYATNFFGDTTNPLDPLYYDLSINSALSSTALRMSNSANTFNNLTLTRGIITLSSSDNTVYGNITHNSGSQLDMHNITAGLSVKNIIHGNISVSDYSGTLFMHKANTGSLENTISGNVTASEGRIVMSNLGQGGSITNTISGTLTIAGRGRMEMYNNGTGTLTSTVNNVTLQDTGSLWLGGPNSQTQINNFTWQQGTLKVHSGDSADFGFGTTHINHVVFPAANGVIQITGIGIPAGDTATYTLLSYDTYAGDPANVQFDNGNSLVEIQYAPGTTNGFHAAGAGGGCQVTVTKVPLGNSSSTTDTATIGVANTLIQSISSPIRGGMTDFRFGPDLQQSFYELQRQHKREKEKAAAFKDMLQVIAEATQGSPFVKKIATYKLWMTPYYSHTHNDNFWQKGFSENIYGLMMGGSKKFKEKEITVGVTLGGGFSKTQMKLHREDRTEGKQFVCGAFFTKSFDKKLELNANFSGLSSYYDSQRLGQPSPGQSYLAKSDYHTLIGDGIFEAGYIVWLPYKLSLRPELGVETTLKKRYGYTERGAGSYAQTYKTNTEKDTEVYTGLSLRKAITGEQYEAKFTCLYEIGVKTNRHRKSDIVFTQSSPNGVRFTLPEAGTVAHYINTYFSLLNMKNDFKVYAGVVSVIQQNQKSFMFSVKMEYRF